MQRRLWPIPISCFAWGDRGSRDPSPGRQRASASAGAQFLLTWPGGRTQRRRRRDPHHCHDAGHRLLGHISKEIWQRAFSSDRKLARAQHDHPRGHSFSDTGHAGRKRQGERTRLDCLVAGPFCGRKGQRHVEVLLVRKLQKLRGTNSGRGSCRPANEPISRRGQGQKDMPALPSRAHI